MEDDGNIPNTCNFLKDPLSISALIDGGAKFEINTNFDEGFSNEIYEELNIGSDDDNEDDAKTELDRSTLASPWTKTFAELKQQMIAVNEHIYKKIIQESTKKEDGPVPPNARVCIRYNAYWEGEGAPFDSSFLRGSSHNFYTGRNEVIEGLEAAVLTMHRGEHAQFVIAYQLLFHEMGCPPRIKPRADGLFIIELVSYNAVGDIDAEQQVPPEDRHKYALVIDKIKEIHQKGLDFFGQGMHRNAVRAFEKAVYMLNYCRLANEEEEREQTAFLLKLYTNLAICYNKVNLPAKTCIMCREIRRLTDNSPPCKALFQEAHALRMLGEYERARPILTRAQRMEPQNEYINKEMKVLEKHFAQHKESEKLMWTRAMGVIQKTETVTTAPEESKFEQEMLELMQAFKENASTSNFKLPPGLTEKEIETVDALAEQMDLQLTLSPLDNSIYTLKKK